MYRSLSEKWLPKKGFVPEITQKTLKELYPIFVDRIKVIESGISLTTEEKTRLHANLSKGPVNKKWGAFPVAIWLALEANGEDKNLIPWIQKGPESIILLAKKYLPTYNKRRS